MIKCTTLPSTHCILLPLRQWHAQPRFLSLVRWYSMSDLRVLLLFFSISSRAIVGVIDQVFLLWSAVEEVISVGDSGAALDLRQPLVPPCPFWSVWSSWGVKYSLRDQNYILLEYMCVVYPVQDWWFTAGVRGTRVGTGGWEASNFPALNRGYSIFVIGGCDCLHLYLLRRE